MTLSYTVILRLNLSFTECLGVQPGMTKACNFLDFNQCYSG